MTQMKVKSSTTPLLPATLTFAGPDGNVRTVRFNSGRPGLEFDARLSEHGDQWVMVNGVVQMGGIANGTTTVPFAADLRGNAYSAPPAASAQGSSIQTSYSTANETGRVAKTTSGVVFGISGYNSKGSAQFIMLIDSGGTVGGALPADGATSPVYITVPASSNFSIDFGYWGFPCASGISVCNSSTALTKAVGSADCTFAIRYT